ncbi:hypothetical protein ACFL02_00460 [Planctomycetota bacterium]
MPEDLEINGNEETFTVEVVYETHELYGTIKAARQIVIYREEQAGEEKTKQAIIPETDVSVFEMKEFSVFDYQGPLRPMLAMGTAAIPETGPSAKVKVYPELKSDQPFYGRAIFDMSLIDYGEGIEYCFVIDESAGSGSGYDRLYFDVNHDFDLTNDPAVEPMAEPPAGARRLEGDFSGGPKEICFNYLEVNIDYGQGKKSAPVKILPRFEYIGADYQLASFVMPTARKGKIKLGDNEYEAILAQGTIAGRYDRPSTYFLLEGLEDIIPLICCWRRCEDGTFYKISATPSGAKLMVEPYKGEFGTLEVGPGQRELEDVPFKMVWLQSQDALINADQCPKEDGKIKVPVGDYRFFQAMAQLGDTRVTMRAIITPDVAAVLPDEPAAFDIKIRPDKPFVYDFPGKPEVIFSKPQEHQRIKAGHSLEIEALLFEPTMHIMIAGLDDTTRPEGPSISLPDGKELQIFAQLDPMIKITNAAGETVAEGTMPFG